MDEHGFVGDQPKELTWGQVKGGHGATFTVNARYPVVIEGMRIHNLEDALVPMKSQKFTYRGNWSTYNRDDCVENDAYASGTIEDNLFDGCFAFYSAVNYWIADHPIAVDGGPSGLVTVRNNLIYMQSMPGPPNRDASQRGFGITIKAYDSTAPNMAFHDNIILMEQKIDTGNYNLFYDSDIKRAKLVSCSSNTIVWRGTGSYPGTYPTQCFKVTTDKSVWDNAVKKWKADHPKVARIPGVDN